MTSWICVLAAGFFAACQAAPSAEKPQAAEAEAPPAVVKTVELTAADAALGVEGVATLMSPETLLQLDADLRNAEIALEFSRRQFERFRTASSLSRTTVDTAERQVNTDTTQVRLLEARLRQTWGEQAPFLAAGPRHDMVQKLADGELALVHMNFPGRIAGTPSNVRIVPLGGGAETAVTTLWQAPSGNQAMPGVSYLGLIQTGPGLRNGDRAKVIAEAAQLRGIVIPSASIIVTEGQTWCYVETAPQKFERRRVALDNPVPEGYLVEAGFTPGTKVVVKGASTLLAREAAPGSGDDDDDAPAKPKAKPAPVANAPAKDDDDDAKKPVAAAPSDAGIIAPAAQVANTPAAPAKPAPAAVPDKD